MTKQDVDISKSVAQNEPGGDGLPDSLRRASAALVVAGLTMYAAMSAVSTTGASIGLLLAIAGAIPLWLGHTTLHLDRGLAIALGAYIAVKFVTVVFALDTGLGFGELIQYWPYLIIVVVPLAFVRELPRGRLLRILAISCALVSVYAIWQYFSGIDYWRGIRVPMSNGLYRAVGFFDHPQTWSGFSLVATLFFAGLAATARSDRLLFAGTSLICFFAHIAALTRGAIIGLIIGTMLMALGDVRLRRASFVMLILAIVGASLSPGLQERFRHVAAEHLNPEVTTSRLYIWDTALSMGGSRPLIGLGPGNFRHHYARFGRVANTEIFGHAHNEWIHEWATSGLLGVLGFTALLALMSRALWKRHREGSLVAWPALVAWAGLIAASLVQCHFRDDEVFMMIVFVVSLGLLPAKPDSEER